jgi:hypothetical protein
MSDEFNLTALSQKDKFFVSRMVGDLRKRPPDLILRNKQDEVQVARWHLTPRSAVGGVYLHVFLGADDRPYFHDHPYANSTLILAGGYREIMPIVPHSMVSKEFVRREGDLCSRIPEQPHKIILDKEFPYAITLFTYGPRLRQWGWWINGVWRAASDPTLPPELFEPRQTPKD